MDYRIILASGSPRRKDMLRELGVSFEIVKSTLEEKTDELLPSEVVKDLSRQKALDVYEKVIGQREEANESEGEPLLVIAADTVVSVDDKILGKPSDENEAFEMIKMIQGRSHRVYTGVCVACEGCDLSDAPVLLNFSEGTTVNVCSMSDDEINAYISTKEPMDKAGAYGIQGLFKVYVSGIEGDYDNVVGLPVSRLYQELKREGIVLGC